MYAREKSLKKTEIHVTHGKKIYLKINLDTQMVQNVSMIMMEIYFQIKMEIIHSILLQTNILPYTFGKMLSPTFIMAIITLQT